jgi:hypothetical protein
MVLGWYTRNFEWTHVANSRRVYDCVVLEPHVAPFAKNICPEFILQQDNAQNVQVMDWPARSPDLNTIEHI